MDDPAFRAEPWPIGRGMGERANKLGGRGAADGGGDAVGGSKRQSADDHPWRKAGSIRRQREIASTA